MEPILGASRGHLSDSLAFLSIFEAEYSLPVDNFSKKIFRQANFIVDSCHNANAQTANEQTK